MRSEEEFALQQLCEDEDMATYKQLIAQKETLEAKLEEVRANEAASIIAQIQGLMVEYGLTVEEIAPKRRCGRPVW
jgi:DNA-binding protein H-NS